MINLFKSKVLFFIGLSFVIGAIITASNLILPKNINNSSDKNSDTPLKIAELHGLRVKKDIKKFAKDVDIILIGAVKSINEMSIPRTVTVQVDEYLKNPQPTKELTIKLRGGKIGDTILIAEDEVQFTIGEKVLLFLGMDYKKDFVVYAGDYGKFTIENDFAFGSEKEKVKLDDLVKEIKENIKK